MRTSIGMAALLIAMAGSARAVALDLDCLNHTEALTGIVINGVDRGDRSGYCVSSAGDVNGDGVDDLIIGAIGGDPGGNSGAGESYVIFGRADVGNSGAIELSTLDGSDGFVVNGVDPNDFSGVSVSSAGDVNGDGIGDLIIGADGADPNGVNGAGESYVVFGRKGIGTSGSVDLSSLDGTNGFVAYGVDPDDQCGFSVSSAGDINGDGFDDVLIGAKRAYPNGSGFQGLQHAGESYVIFGGADVGSDGFVELGALDGTNGFVINGAGIGDESGTSVSSVGDINGDGMDDIVIGAPDADSNFAKSGKSYVLFGHTDVGASGSLELSSLNGTNGFVVNGAFSSQRSGYRVSGAGDINGDDIDDLLIGVLVSDPQGAPPEPGPGGCYVVFGRADIGLGGSLPLPSNGITGFYINGVDDNDRCGSALSSAGDVNGDGFDDIIVGAYGADPNGFENVGESYVLFGSTGVGSSGTIELATLSSTQGFVLNGAMLGRSSGSSVALAGDINNDGVSDVLIGAPNAVTPKNGVTQVGESYLIFGSPAVGQPVPQDLTANGCVDSADLAAVLASWGTPAADLNGDGVTDSVDLAILLAAWSNSGMVVGTGVDPTSPY